jgi:response regulator RpfG family c-di-GMP phosphodiesterase
MKRRRRRITATLGQIGSLDERDRERPRSDVHVIGEDAPIILIVDANAESRLALFHMLRRIYCVIEASDAATAIALSVQHSPAAIVSSAAMLDHDGNRLATLLRLALGSNVPPLIVIGGADSRDVTVALPTVSSAAGVDAMSLISAIEEMVEQQHAAARAAEQAG